ncbi:MAG: ATPase, partial [Methanomicrobiales archaeon]|nr:ATPase [Methanomicrobiales archaeon]
PDFVIFDELRKNEDFGVYSDLRLSGVGMIGVVHALGTGDALWRFFDRVAFGVLPQIINTIIFMQGGEVTRLFDLSFSMKVPEGMSGNGHPCPVIIVKDRETDEIELEIFKYDGETILLPGKGKAAPKAAGAPPAEEKFSWKLAEKEIQREIGRYTDGHVEVKMLSDTKALVYIDDKDVPAAIGKGGKNVSSIVNKLGIGIDIRPKSELEKPEPEGDLILEGGIRIHTDKRQLAIIATEHKGKIVDVFSGKEYLFTATVNDDGEIHLAKNSTIAQEMIRRHQNGEIIRLRPV